MMSCSSPPFLQWENHCACALELPWFICKCTGIHIGIPYYYKSSDPHHLFSNPFSMPVTYIYSMETGPPHSIEHRGLAYHYTAYIYIYIYIYMHTYMYIYVTGMQKGLGKQMMRFRLSIIFGILGMDASRCADEPWHFCCACTVVFPS